MDLTELQKHWNEFGRTDPLWAILTTPERKGGRWSKEEFFETGRGEIAGLMSHAQRLGFPRRRDTALDFGCGVGRLTQALCAWFGRCCGLDIAPSMIQLAEQYNTFGQRCEYHLNQADDLRHFPDSEFDLVYSSIVLQHMQPAYSAAYIRDFIRVLRPQGLLAFQLPAQPKLFVPRPGATAGTGPLPNAAFRAVFSDYPPKVILPANSALAVPVTVKNAGSASWPAVLSADKKYAVQLGNHWRTPKGTVVAWDDGRQCLPFDLLPEQSLDLTLVISAPRDPGSYILEVDMVQEHVAWFGAKGSKVARIDAEVQPVPSTEAERSDGDFAPRMEVYGTEKSEVLRLLTEHGARVLDVIENEAAGPEWSSFTYFATK